jgi:hypothetical protein
VWRATANSDATRAIDLNYRSRPVVDLLAFMITRINVPFQIPVSQSPLPAYRATESLIFPFV